MLSNILLKTVTLNSNIVSADIVMNIYYVLLNILQNVCMKIHGDYVGR